MKERKSIEDKIAKGRKILAQLKDKLTDFRSTPKNTRWNGELSGVLRSIDVKLTQYHGGSLAGMVIKKVIANATYVFDEFGIGKILVKYKSPDCKVKNIILEELKLCLLWWVGSVS